MQPVQGQTEPFHGEKEKKQKKEKEQTLYSEQSTVVPLQIQKLSVEARRFYDFHGVQLLAMGFPTALIESLYNKLRNSIYDGGSFLDVVDDGETGLFEVKAKTSVGEGVFIIDHALTYRQPELRKILQTHSGLRERLQLMLRDHKQLRDTAQEQASNPNQVELEGMSLDQLGSLRFPQTLVTLSLVNNNISNAAELIKKLEYPNLKALWLNGNPVEQDPVLKQHVLLHTRIELFNSKFTPHCSDWGFKYVQQRDASFAASVASSELGRLVLDNRDVFQVKAEVFEQFINLKVLSLRQHDISEPKQMEYLHRVLELLPKLRELRVDETVELKLLQSTSPRLKKVMVNGHDREMGQSEKGEFEIDQIMEHLPKISGCYRLANTNQIDETACWYVNDELGTLIPHFQFRGKTKIQPNTRLMPFLFAPNHKLDEEVQAYSLLWLLRGVEEGECLTRDFLQGVQKHRQIRLGVWYALNQESFTEGLRHYERKMGELNRNSIAMMEKFYISNAEQQRAATLKYYSQKPRDKHVVSTENELIKGYLTSPQFSFGEEGATVKWLGDSAEADEWRELGKDILLNQFPFEACVVMKHHLANTIQETLGFTAFLPRTYNLDEELGLFVGDYHRREQEGMDNLWILKPPNMARSMDMVITDNLSLILRYMETGPKIAQKYIENPVLLSGRKVDFRYILLVRSVRPLVLLLYRHFWIRSANLPFSLDRRLLSSYETQFTVMNYKEVSEFKQIPHEDFERSFQSVYAPQKWSTVHEKVKKMLRNTFIAASTRHPEMQQNNSRAMYGVDVMVDAGSFEPKLLQITFAPDCKRACVYYPEFYNHVFEALFLNGNPPTFQRII